MPSTSSSRERAVVVDAGANIGLTSVYFANLYSQAKMISIESEAWRKTPHATRTSRPSRRPCGKPTRLSTSTIQAAATGDSRKAKVKEVERPGAWLGGVTVDTLMREQGVDFIDILEVDIEGSEKEVFESCASWIDRGGILIVELHDRWTSGVQSKCPMSTPLLLPSLSTGRAAKRLFSSVRSKAGQRLVACGRQWPLKPNSRGVRWRGLVS